MKTGLLRTASFLRSGSPCLAKQLHNESAKAASSRFANFLSLSPVMDE